MLKTVKDACKLHEMALTYAITDQIENLSDLIAEQSDGGEFFAKTYITEGMEQLFRQGLRRLAGKSDQNVFLLNQAMGGGKTHLMIALGLLAKNSNTRYRVVPGLAKQNDFGTARLAAISGRNNPEHFIWGEIAAQLGKPERFTRFWANGARAPDEKAWIELIGNGPALILLDELPPYLDNAMTISVGGGTLAQTTTYAISSLLSAALRLPRLCIVISTLSGAYESASRDLHRTVRNITKEVDRQAKPITPVKLGGSEIYGILRKRLFSELPPEQDIDEVAGAYARAISEAEKSRSIGKSTEQLAEEIRAAYPFHPAVKDLIALFKENESFRQTRGLMQFISKLLKSVWERPQNDIHLIGVQHLNLNDLEVREEVLKIANLQGALAKDIADSGNAHAELIDAKHNSDSGSQVAGLLLVSSLSTSVDATKGLNKQRVLECLIAPNRSTIEFSTVFEQLKSAAWYLHRDESDSYYFSNQENLTKRLELEADRAPQNRIEQEIKIRLETIFQPHECKAYQRHIALPLLDEVSLNGPRTLLIISPDSKMPPEEAWRYYDSLVEKNNLCLVTGDGSDIASLENAARRVYAATKVQGEMAQSHPQYLELQERVEGAELEFNSTVTATFNRIYYPSRKGLISVKLSMTFANNDFNAEKQIEETLAALSVSKLKLDLESKAVALLDMAEHLLWPQSNERHIPWRDVVRRSQENPRWSWLPDKGLENLRALAIKQGRWRYTEDGYIEKGPFPKEKTSVEVTEHHYNDTTGEAAIRITPKNAGHNAIVHYAETPAVNANSPVLVEYRHTTDKTRLYFLAIDADGAHETGEAVRWSNRLTITHQPKEVSGRRNVELHVAPRGQIHYTLDGSNPKEGALYTSPFDIGPDETVILVYAEDAGVEARHKFTVSKAGDTQIKVDPLKPATLRRKQSFASTAESYRMITQAKTEKAIFNGATLEVGRGDKSAVLRFGNDSEIQPAALENLIEALREALGDDTAEVRINIRAVRFSSGHNLHEYMGEYNITPEPGQIEQ
ncbi:MAG: DUF499 domain-containing protein [Gammaproteobacteria bacterium]|nr:DUF499 domain-containing protein [Gammaproteobacteria bacterium]